MKVRIISCTLSVLMSGFFLLSALYSKAFVGGPVRVIFDTDMGNDIDDALALAMLHTFESRGEAKLLAVTLTKDNPWAALYVDVVNTFYGRGDIPVGIVRNGKTPQDSDMIRAPCERKRPDGTTVYPRHFTNGHQVPEAVGLLRRILSAEKDGTVTLIQVGFSTNLARLLDSSGDAHSPLNGRELVARRVRLLSMMAGAFPNGKPEYNIKTDLPAARKLFAEWPTPIVVSGFEVGNSILYPAQSIERDFRYADHHPVVDAYRAYKRMPYDRPTWDPTAALYAVRPERGYFSLSPPGRIRVDEEGRTHFAEAPDGKHRYLIVNDVQRVRILEAMISLVSQPPTRRSN